MQFKFLTLNILHGGVLWDSLVEFIHKEDPDIACFQEVYDGRDANLEKRFRTMEEFKKEFPDLTFSIFKALFEEESIGIDEGNAIFSKFQILETNYIWFNSDYKRTNSLIGSTFQHVPSGMTECLVDVNGKRFYVYSIHGVWDTHGNDTPARDQMTEVVVKALKGKEYIILGGDTNLYHDTNFVRRLEHELELKSVFGDSLQSTFNMLHKTGSGYANASVDMIFVSKNIKVIDKYMPIDDVSDHRPLTAMLEI